MRFLAVYMGGATEPERNSVTPLQNQDFMAAWEEWAAKYSAQIVDHGAPLGKTKRIDAGGISDIRNAMVAYTLVDAQSHEEAARMFEKHPHNGLFAGNWIEVMPCLQLPNP